jgi:hypothetical protein
MTPAQKFHLVLADGILVIHVAFVAFVIVGLALIWLGGWRRWAYVRNFWFRVAHLAAIGVVAAESLAFIQHWLHQLLFYDVSERVFTLIYVAFFTAVALSLWLVPPLRPGRKPQAS